MGIFSFGKKDDAPTRRGANTRSNRPARNERVERRSRRPERTADTDAMLLDPTLPEKQRARRRLVGAIALVVAAVVILPMVLDSHPKPVTDDIAIDIPSRPAPKAQPADDDTQAGVAPDNPAPDTATGASGLAPAPSLAANPQKSAGARNAPTPTDSGGKVQTPPAVTAHVAPPPAAKPTQSAKPGKSVPPAAQIAGNSPLADNANATAAAPDADSGTPASPAGSRFAVQLGSFPDDATARTWATKLKAAGVPAYTERRKQADGSTRTLLRAGPFPDRAAATAAIEKVREAGLTSGANNGTAQ